MGFNEVIDLSSDNEAPLPALGTTTATTSAARTTSPFHLATVSHDGFGRLNEQQEDNSSKRRKLSSSAIDDDGKSAVRYSCTDLDLPSRKRPYRTKAQEEVWATFDESDPIVFTSSLGHNISQVKSRTVDNDASDDSLPEDLFSVPSLAKPSALSSRTSALLDRLSQPALAKAAYARNRTGDKATKSDKTASLDPMDNEECSSLEEGPTATRKKTKASRKNGITEEERAAQAQKKEREKMLKINEKENAKTASKEQKAKEKEEDRERKRILKEEKARGKRIAADLAEVNKLKVDKKDSTPEMIVDLPASSDGQRIDTQIREFLKNLGVDATLYQSQVPNVIKWRRKMKARWNAEMGHWEPIERMEILEEKHVLCMMSAKEFIALAMAQDDDQDLETHVIKMKSAYGSCTPIYLIEGLYASMKRNRTAENRAYQAKVNSIGHSDDVHTSSQVKSKKKKPAVELLDEDLIEDALLRLQVMSGCLVHHTAAAVETAEWVANFTQHISTIPYRYIMSNLF